MIFLTLPLSPKRLGSSIQELDNKDIHFIHVEKNYFTTLQMDTAKLHLLFVL